jgi:uncharacterized Fe-S center protein
MGEKNRMKKVIYFTDLNKIGEAFEYFEIKSFSNKEVPIKLHMGEKNNKFYPKPDFVKLIVDELIRVHAQPYLFDTTVAYNASRQTKRGYENLAKTHGFTKENVGCPVLIEEKGIQIKIDGRKYCVAEHIYNSTHILGLSHVKAHVATGFGGAIKNFGMGGVTKETKIKMHRGSKPLYDKDKCTFCGVCAEVCPFNALDVKEQYWKQNNTKCFGCGVCVDSCECSAIKNIDKDIQYFLAASTKACVQNKYVIYLNELKRISDSCDCDPYAKEIICPDIGYLLSDDPVAIDKASLDLIHDIKSDLFKKFTTINPIKQINYSEDLGLGVSSYKLIEI